MLKDFFESSHDPHSSQENHLSLSCHSLRALEKESSNHIHSISLPHFPLENISSLIHKMYSKECALAVSVTVLGSILILGCVKAEDYSSENFDVRNETYNLNFHFVYSP